MAKRKRKIKKRYKILLGVFVSVVAISLWQIPLSFWTGTPITISSQTTFITGPLTDDGLVDYVAATNELMNDGVANGDNAFIALLQAIEIIPAGAARDDILNSLNVPSLKVGPALDPDPIGKAYGKLDYDEYAKIEEVVSLRAWTADEYPELAAELRAIEPILQHVFKAAEKPGFFMPLEHDPTGLPLGVNSRFESESVFRYLARTLLFDSLFQIGEGNTTQSLNSLMSIRRLERHLRNTGYWADYFIGFTFAVRAFQAESAIFQNCSLSSSQLREYAQFLQSTTPELIDCRQRLEFDRLYALATLQLYAHVPRFQSLGLDNAGVGSNNDTIMLMDRLGAIINWNQAMAAMNTSCDRLRDQLTMVAQKPGFEHKQHEYKSIELEFRRIQDDALTNTSVLKALFFGPGARGHLMGTYFMDYLFTGYADILESQTRQLMQRDVSILAALVLSYQLDHGHYPEKLETLVPQYIEAIPQDRKTHMSYGYVSSESGFDLKSSDDEAAIEVGPSNATAKNENDN